MDYFVYFAASLVLALRLKPKMIYASDPLSAGPALLAAKICGSAVLYHEHDTPGPSSLRPMIVRWRICAARLARLVITPNEERGRQIQQAIGFSHDRLRTVWNMPRRAELPPLSLASSSPLILYYHGSVAPERLPVNVVEAVRSLDGRVILRVCGYEVPGARGYIDQLLQLGQRVGATPLVDYIGHFPRETLLEEAASAHVGLALMPLTSDDINMRHMTGASNKAFDYMASGLALLVSDLADWRTMFVEPGYARACNPNDTGSIVRALRWFLDNEGERRQMAARGRARIEADWNYDAAFAPILTVLNNLRTPSHD
jgi:glycosyltransferase involved in cell wall biosynthesis